VFVPYQLRIATNHVGLHVGLGLTPYNMVYKNAGNALMGFSNYRWHAPMSDSANSNEQENLNVNL